MIGSRLVGLNPRDLHGFDYVRAAKGWYDKRHGVYRHTRGQCGNAVYHADIYGYWAGIQGLMLASQYPDDPDFQRQVRSTVKAFLRIAHGMGCPDNPNFDVLGFNFDKGAPEGRPEPMNRLGHVPSVAWPLLVGYRLTDDPEMLACARAAMQWHINHPGRYEVSHVMGPLTAARLNAEYDSHLDLDRVLATWFGDGELARTPWKVTAGTRLGGMTCDGLDGADWGGGEPGFHAFAMGTLQGPAWLVPVARYDPRYARDIGHYALHAACSARLLQGFGLDWDHQDHMEWKAQWDPHDLLFYEALTAWDWCGNRDVPAVCHGRSRATRLGGAEGWPAELSRGETTGLLEHLPQPRAVHGQPCRVPRRDHDIDRCSWHPSMGLPGDRLVSRSGLSDVALLQPLLPGPDVPYQRGAMSRGPLRRLRHEVVEHEVSGLVLLTLPPDAAAVIVVVPACANLVTEGHRASQRSRCGLR